MDNLEDISRDKFVPESAVKKLWLHVMERVFIDAFSPLSEKNFDIRCGDVKKEARNYVLSNGKPFKQLCWMCGLEPSWVRNQFMQRIELEELSND